MSVKERLRKIRTNRVWKLADEEKTGVVNGLVLLGAVAGAIAALEHTHEADAATAGECDGKTGETIRTGIEGTNFGFDYSDWGNHCWWDHSWNDDEENAHGDVHNG